MEGGGGGESTVTMETVIIRGWGEATKSSLQLELW